MNYLDYCLTYFLVDIGDTEKFDLKDFCDSLGLDYDKTENFSTEDSIEIGRNECYDKDINVMIRKTLSDLLGKEKILSYLKVKYSLDYTLERVPLLHVDAEADQQMRLTLDDDVIAFMYKTGTHDDLDYFLG